MIEEVVEGIRLGVGDCIGMELVDRFDLLYIDPPFGPIGEDKYYGECETFDGYIEYIYERVVRLCEGKEDYNVVIHIDPKASHYLKVRFDSFFGRDSFCNEIIWGWSGPSSNKGHLPRKHGVLLWYGKGDYVFNPVYVSYNEAALRVGGKTSWAGEKKEVREYIKRGKMIEDWWVDIPPLIRNESEKRGYATQKPVKLLERIVGMLSREGGLVIDPMFGSGTTAIACKNLGRLFYGSDKSVEAMNIAKKALLGS